MTTRRALVSHGNKPSMRRQCELLGVSRAGLYYQPIEPSADELALMRRIDELHLEHPFFGSRMMSATLRAEARVVNRKRVQRLMRLMGLESLAPKPNTSKPSRAHPVYPYLLRNLTISRVNHVWASDISVPQRHKEVFLEKNNDLVEAAREMEAGPPRSVCRDGSQTTMSRVGQKPAW